MFSFIEQWKYDPAGIHVFDIVKALRPVPPIREREKERNKEREKERKRERENGIKREREPSKREKETDRRRETNKERKIETTKKKRTRERERERQNERDAHKGSAAKPTSAPFQMFSGYFWPHSRTKR